MLRMNCCRLLKDAEGDIYYRQRYRLVMQGLLSLVGRQMREELLREDRLTRMVSEIARKVKQDKNHDVSFLIYTFTLYLIILIEK